uniref:Reticulon n=1 Tax=Neolamprologus brichardi TaxID=32507 RepID=A0A3Q4MLM7_NEOBR
FVSVCSRSTLRTSVASLSDASARFRRSNFLCVVDLLYWRDVKTTGVVFGAALLLLLSLTVCSIVSVCSYICLALLSVTICFRIYKGILQAIQKSDEGHPFKQYLDQEVALSEDMVHKYSDIVLAKLNKTIGDLRRVFLVEDLVDSIKVSLEARMVAEEKLQSRLRQKCSFKSNQLNVSCCQLTVHEDCWDALIHCLQFYFC